MTSRSIREKLQESQEKMFKGGKWKSDEHKTSKAVFKLQFQATQVPQLGWDSLMVALVPSETGKATTKTENVQVCDGVCQWEKPVFETIKLTRDGKTEKLDMKTYQFIVLNGTKNGGLLGKAMIDIAEYEDAIDPFCVSLPLGTSSSTVLHVTIQRVSADGDKRDKKKSETTSTQNCKSFGNNIRHFDTDGSSRTSTCSPDTYASKDKSASHGIVQFSSSMTKTVPLTSECNGSPRCTFGTILESLGAHSNSRRGFTQFKNSFHKDTISFLSSLKRRKALSLRSLASEHNDITNHTEREDSNMEYYLNWDQNESRESTTNTSKDIIRNEKLQAAEISIEQLKKQIAVMKRQAELSDLEVQALRKHIVKENRKMQEFSREIFSLRKERDALREEHEQLKVLKAQENAEVMNNSQYDSNDSICITSEITQELNYEKGLNANLRQLEKIQDANSQLILAVRDLEEQLEQKDKEISRACITRSSTPVTHESCKEISKTENHQTNKSQSIQCSKGTNNEEDQAQLELEVLIKKHDYRSNASSSEQIVSNLQSEIAEYKKICGKLEMQMEQLALDYEILKQENHKLKELQIQEQLKMQHEISIFLVVNNDLETHVQNLEKELIMQEEAFIAELEALTHHKVEQEQRAIKAEELLRKTRQSNADTAERLQEEFRKLSFQMASTFGKNEKLTAEAIKESSDLCIQKSHLENLLKRTFQLAKDQYKERNIEFSAQVDSKTHQMSKLQSEVECLTSELKCQQETAEAKSSAQLIEILSLKTDSQTLPTAKRNHSRSVQEKECLVQMEEMKSRMDENVLLLQKEVADQEIFQGQVLLPRDEAEELQEETYDMRHLPIEKDMPISMLQTKPEKMSSKHNEVERSLTEDQFEKENLKEQAFQQRNDLKGEEDSKTDTGKKIENKSLRFMATYKNQKSCPRNSKISSDQHSIKKTIKLQEKIKFLQESLTQDCKFSASSCEKAEVSINGSAVATRTMETAAIMLDQVHKEVDKCNSTILNSRSEEKICCQRASNEGATTKLINEIAQLKKKNTLMEDELKEMQERYSQMSLKFAEVEGERQQLVMAVRNLKNAKRT